MADDADSTAIIKRSARKPRLTLRNKVDFVHKLPDEILNEIYGLVLVRPKPIAFKLRRQVKTRPLGLLLTCRKVYYQAFKIYYTKNVFIVDIPTRSAEGFSPALRAAASILTTLRNNAGEDSKDHDFGGLHFKIVGLSWPDPLAELSKLFKFAIDFGISFCDINSRTFDDIASREPVPKDPQYTVALRGHATGCLRIVCVYFNRLSRVTPSGLTVQGVHQYASNTLIPTSSYDASSAQGGGKPSVASGLVLYPATQDHVPFTRLALTLKRAALFHGIDKDRTASEAGYKRVKLAPGWKLDDVPFAMRPPMLCTYPYSSAAAESCIDPSLLTNSPRDTEIK